MKHGLIAVGVLVLLSGSATEAAAAKGKRKGCSSCGCNSCRVLSWNGSGGRWRDNTARQDRFAFRAATNSRRVSFADAFFHKVTLEGGR